MGYILDGSSADCADLSALLSFLSEINMAVQLGWTPYHFRALTPLSHPSSTNKGEQNPQPQTLPSPIQALDVDPDPKHPLPVSPTYTRFHLHLSLIYVAILKGISKVRVLFLVFLFPCKIR
ncbi:hypothetical protein MRB53_002756 [Persea americana]|uniref:Uncharacterized protein n=1 Tax=Persea americana TaxID=3435 RepID=A0ACC2MVS2_PERAE|nr:hypothetical protein MRB53_002756 [Persea americana]